MGLRWPCLCKEVWCCPQGRGGAGHTAGGGGGGGGLGVGGVGCSRVPLRDNCSGNIPRDV